MSIRCSRRSGGLTLPVHVTPGAKQNRVGDQHDGALRVWVTAPADQGRANQAVLKALAQTLRLRRGQLALVGGQSHRRKTIWIESDDPDDLIARIAALANPDPT